MMKKRFQAHLNKPKVENCVKLREKRKEDFDGIVLHVESESDTYKTRENFVIIAKVTNNTQKPIII